MDIFATLEEKNVNKEYVFHCSHITPGFFINERINSYLQGPIQKFTLPKKSTDKVELEPIASSFLPDLFPYRPKLFYLPDEKITVQRIVGYREIYSKRLRIEFLKLIEDEQNVFRKGNMNDLTNVDWISEVAPGGGRNAIPPPEEEDDDGEYDDELDDIEEELQDESKNEDMLIKKAKSLKFSFTPNDEAQQRKSEEKDKEVERIAERLQNAKIQKDLDYFRANKDQIDEISRRNSRFPSAVNSVHALRKQQRNSNRTSSRANRDRYDYDDYDDHDGHDDHDQHSPHLHTPPEFYDHNAAAYILRHEKDYEWLELSDSNDDPGVESLTKPHMPWMIKKLAHETQLLQHHLNLFYKSCKYFGRQFYFMHANIQTRQIEYVVKKRKEIYFFLTTAAIWVPLCLIIESYIDIQFFARPVGSYREAEFVFLEKYKIMLTTVMANMFLVGIWSVTTILQDSLVITHYLNCWNLALNEMETSAVTNIVKITEFNLVFFVVHTAIIGTAFYFDWPRTVRGTSGLISNLILRGVISDMYLQKDKIIYYEIFGACFYLYCIYCARCLHMLIQIVATIIRNSSEMWNLKFGLTFSQFIVNNRGQLEHIHLGHSLVKIFTHHRLICGLVNIFGEAFAWPIVVFITVQMAVFLSIITGFIFMATRPAHNESDYIEIYGTDYLKTNSSYTNAHSHSFKELTRLPLREEVITMSFVAVYTLIDFLLTTEIIAKAGQSFVDGFEFVRRQNVILCTTSHQRRLVQSLEWSMSAASPNILSVRQYFSLHRTVIFSAITSAFAFFSLIIQIKTKTKEGQFDIYYKLTKDCAPYEPEFNRLGYCLHKIVPELA